MPTAICCPSCKRVLSLPAEALNSQVQCPACKHQFHPAEAMPAENIRAAPIESNAIPTNGQSAAPASSSSPPLAEGTAGRESDRKLPPAPPPDYEPRRNERRNKRGIQDLCPNCQAFVDAGVNVCPGCGAEFEPEDDAGYRPWEQAGLERRDSESHRGGLLLFMGIASLVLPFFFWVCYLGIAMSLIGLVLSAATAWMGKRDLRKMRDHAMAREGEGLTSGARICGYIGIIFNLLGLVAAIALVTLLH
jgi:hypothetical protein